MNSIVSAYHFYDLLDTVGREHTHPVSVSNLQVLKDMTALAKVNFLHHSYIFEHITQIATPDPKCFDSFWRVLTQQGGYAHMLQDYAHISPQFHIGYRFNILLNIDCLTKKAIWIDSELLLRILLTLRRPLHRQLTNIQAGEEAQTTAIFVAQLYCNLGLNGAHHLMPPVPVNVDVDTIIRNFRVYSFL